MESLFTLKGPGKASLSEYHRKTETGADLLEHSFDKGIELEVMFGWDQGGPEDESLFCAVQAGFFHLVNPETERQFCAHVTAHLDREQLSQLHAYIGFLLQHAGNPPQDWPL
jgi:hypothetical protein